MTSDLDVWLRYIAQHERVWTHWMTIHVFDQQVRQASYFLALLVCAVVAHTDTAVGAWLRAYSHAVLP